VKAAPIPEWWLSAATTVGAPPAEAVTIGDSAAHEHAPEPCEYLAHKDPESGDLALSALVVLTDAERARLAAGADLCLTLYRGEVPWRLTVADPF
jgi:hypothetical protein